MGRNSYRILYIHLYKVYRVVLLTRHCSGITKCWIGFQSMHSDTKLIAEGALYEDAFARAYLSLFLFDKVSKYAFGQETDRQGRYRCKNTDKFIVSATQIQWKTSRTRIRPKCGQNN